MLTCNTCGHFANPLRELHYPIGEHVPESRRKNLKWVRCAVGNTVNEATTGCGVHTDKPTEEAPRRQLVHTPASATTKRRLVT